MSERRIDPFTGRGVILAPARRGIGASKPSGLPSPEGRCPFCPGHEPDTERTLAAWPNEEAWAVRVVGNKYPLFEGEDGDHEVGIDARAHDVDLDALSPAHVAAMLRLYRSRVQALAARAGIKAVVLFRNRGRRAGSSQPHPHSQLVAMRDVPVELAVRWERAEAHLAAHGEPLYLTDQRRELASDRVLALDDEVLVHCPYAPSRPYEVRIAPRAPAGGFDRASDGELESVATHLVLVLGRLRERVAITDYNLVVRHPPSGAAGPAAAWHLDILPRTGGDAGYELASGELVVVVTPEDAARALR